MSRDGAQINDTTRQGCDDKRKNTDNQGQLSGFSVLDSNLTVRQNPHDSMLSKPPLVNGASAPNQSSPLDNYVQPSLGHGLRLWWAYYWRTSLVSLFVVGFLTFLLRKAWENLLISGHVVLWSSWILSYVVVYGFLYLPSAMS
jgi:hypothetical protein